MSYYFAMLITTTVACFSSFCWCIIFFNVFGNSKDWHPVLLIVFTMFIVLQSCLIGRTGRIIYDDWAKK